ncbi:hypothetical protein [Glycomyces tenuis]|uniref:hypothetical protein n=1 Tax=Glycomyces tenuis TaxID=58116 RepID=UPI000428CD14|nr:hypothetical protein [Glycomyces tenuis]
MEPLAILALQVMHDEARSALPDAPVVEHRPTVFDRIASLRFRAASRAGAPLKRGDVRRAA